MNNKLRDISNKIIDSSIKEVMPYEAVRNALKNKTFKDDLIIVSIGKAAYSMALEASKLVKYEKGIVITKYNHIKGNIDNFELYEAGHPSPDENSIIATKRAIELVSNLDKDREVLLLISGGGSALFEDPLVSLQELQDINKQLLSCGANINEINTIRKRLSRVKGGKFAKIISPAKIYSIIISDIVNDPIDMIASGPTAVDTSTVEDAINIVNKYNLKLSNKAKELLQIETPKELDNVENVVQSGVKALCLSAKKTCEELSFEAIIVNDSIEEDVQEFAERIKNIISNNLSDKKRAYIFGGETTVHLKGNGLGGRNQEIACRLIDVLAGFKNIAFFSIGSDGTDGPTDAAGGYVDGDSKQELLNLNVDYKTMLDNNDSYNILNKIGGLIKTGPTGTNVNDLMVVLID